MANYILAVAKGKSQNRFVTSFSADIDLLSCHCVNCDIIIDTGCMYTKLAASSFGDVNYKKLHQEDIKNYKNNRIGLLLSFGTTDMDRNIDLSNVSDDMLRSDPRICFAHDLSNLSEHLGYLPNTSFMRYLINVGKVDMKHPFICQEYMGM